MNKDLSNHAGLCEECKYWSEQVITSDVERRRIGLFAERYLHKHTHHELRRLFMIRKGIWPSLTAWLQIPEVAEA